MYYLTTKDKKACEYFGSLETFTEEQAENAIKFCCSICGCNHEEQSYLLEWYFDGVWCEFMRFGNKNGEFWRLLDFCGDCWLVDENDDAQEYEAIMSNMLDGDQISGEILPTGRLFVHNV